jgi:hypothetical protein
MPKPAIGSRAQQNPSGAPDGFCMDWIDSRSMYNGLPGIPRLVPVKIPAVVQHLDLSAVFALESAHQLIAKPLRHAASPFQYMA